MAVDRLTTKSTTPGTKTGNAYMDEVAEEIQALWDYGLPITLSAVAGTNTITATCAPAMVSGLQNGMNFILKPAATNTGAVTLNINSGGAVAVVDAEGNALTAGAIRINNHYFLNYDSGIAKFVVIGYTPAAVVPYGLKLLGVKASTGGGGVSSLDFFNGALDDRGIAIVLDGTYDRYSLKINSCAPVTDDVEAWLRIGTGATPTYQTANYAWASTAWGNGTPANIASNSDAKIILTRNSGTVDVGNAAGETFSTTIDFSDPDNTGKMFDCTFHSVWRTAASGLGAAVGFGQYAVAGAITAVRFQFETGNIVAGGVAELYGWAKS